MTWSVFPRCASADDSAAIPATVPADPENGIAPYPVSALELKYKPKSDGLPGMGELLALSVPLCKVGDGWAAPRQGLPFAIVKLSTIGAEPYTKLYPSAIKTIIPRISDYLTDERHLAVVVVEVDNRDLDAQWQDLRVKPRTALALNVWVGRVAQVRTVASGQRLEGQERINNPKLVNIAENSPVQPATTRPGAKAGADVVDKEALDAYTSLLSRFPARKVDMAVSAAAEPGEVVLDYLVNETRWWNAYMQISNTGTKQTSEWRERFGGNVYQMWNTDDILSLDYTTASFSEANSLNIGYEGDLCDTHRLRWKVYGLYSDYQASDVGVTADQFNGTEYHIDGSLSLNIYQEGRAFVDVFGGVDGGHIEVDWKKVGGATVGLPPEGDTGIYSAFVGLRYDRITETASTIGELRLSYDWADAATKDLQNLGRLEVVDNWTTLALSASQSFYLEPLLQSAEFRKNGTVLANEIALSGRAVTTFGQRVIPQSEEILGGFYTVRGYPESAVSGDSALLGSLEYRFHLPRTFAPQEPRDALFYRDFRTSPQRPFGRPDWDLIFRTFLDAGTTMPVSGSTTASKESDQTLVGTGIGMELQVKQNFSIRVDWGVALTKVSTSGQETRPGDNRIHVVATFSY